MADEITGQINEVRRTFEGGGLTGKVEFGRRSPGFNGSSNTTFRVLFPDGRKGWGRYADPKNVSVKLRANASKARKMRSWDW